MSNTTDPQIVYQDPSALPQEKPKKETVYYFLIAAAATVVVLAGIKAASGILGPMLLALFLTIILVVPLRWLREKGCPQTLSLIIVLGGTIFCFVSIGYFVGKSLNEFIQSLPAYRTKIVRKVDELDKKLEQLGFAIGVKQDEKHLPVEPDGQQDMRPEGKTEVKKETSGPKDILEEKPKEPPAKQEESPKSGGLISDVLDMIPSPHLAEAGEEEGEQPHEEDQGKEELEDTEYFKQMVAAERAERPSLIDLDAKTMMYWLTKMLVELRHMAEGGFLVLLFTIFMTFEAARFPIKVDRAFGKEGPINNEHFHRIANDIRRYLFLKAISSLMSAVAATCVYWIFGVPATLFWGVIAFFLYFIPNIGGTLAAIIPGLLIFMTYDLEGVALYAVCLVAIECTIAYGIEPKMLGHGLGISTVVIILSLFSWGWLLGPVGLFLAAPLTIMVKIILQAFKETEWIAILLGDKVREKHGQE